jgi:transposase
LGDRAIVCANGDHENRLFADEGVAVEATWTMYQQTVAAYREPIRDLGRALMASLIDAHWRPKPLQEPITLGRTLKITGRRRPGLFRPAGTRNGPTEAINGRLEHLRGSAPGFRDLTNYIAQLLPETSGFGPHLHPRS